MSTKLASYLCLRKEQSYKDELEKIALGKNYVAEYGIKGSTMGAGIGGAGALVAANKLLKNLQHKAKNPIIASAMVAGAVAGAAAGGRIGAYMGGGKKGTTNLFVESGRH